MVKEILLLSYYLLISDKDLVNFRFNDSAQSSLSIFAQKYLCICKDTYFILQNKYLCIYKDSLGAKMCP